MMQPIDMHACIWAWLLGASSFLGPILPTSDTCEQRMYHRALVSLSSQVPAECVPCTVWNFSVHPQCVPLKHSLKHNHQHSQLPSP